MSYRATFRAVNPEEMIMELTITMPLNEWQELEGQLSQKWPSWDLGTSIKCMAAKARTEFNERGGDAEID